MAYVVMFIAAVVDKPWISFVNRVVGEVHAHHILVFHRGLAVGLCGKSGKSFFVDKNTQRVAAGD